MFLDLVVVMQGQPGLTTVPECRIYGKNERTGVGLEPRVAQEPSSPMSHRRLFLLRMCYPRAEALSLLEHDVEHAQNGKHSRLPGLLRQSWSPSPAILRKSLLKSMSWLKMPTRGKHTAVNKIGRVPSV